MARQKVSNELWAALESLIPEFVPSRKGGRRRSVDDQAALNGIVYVLHTGIPWEDLPQELGFGSGMTCWRRLRDWQAAGVWDKLHLAMLIRLREHDQIDWRTPRKTCVRRICGRCSPYPSTAALLDHKCFRSRRFFEVPFGYLSSQSGTRRGCCRCTSTVEISGFSLCVVLICNQFLHRKPIVAGSFIMDGIAKILGFGAIGFGFLLCLLTYKLLSQAQGAKNISPKQHSLLILFMVTSIIFTITGFVFEYLKMVHQKERTFFISVQMQDASGRPIDEFQVDVEDLAAVGQNSVILRKNADAGAAEFPIKLSNDSRVKIVASSHGQVAQVFNLYPNAITLPARLIKTGTSQDGRGDGQGDGQ
jgi:transposase